jgi:hypothetical protein
VNVRAYGEMVDILWQQGKRAAALALEEMWTDLAEVFPFDLLCAYAMAPFCDAPGTGALSAVCDAHSDVSITLVSTDESQAPDAATALARQTRALAAEIAHRKQVEQTLRSSVRELRQSEARERARAESNTRLADELREDRPHQRAVHGRTGARSAGAAGGHHDRRAADEDARDRRDRDRRTQRESAQPPDHQRTPDVADDSSSCSTSPASGWAAASTSSRNAPTSPRW